MKPYYYVHRIGGFPPSRKHVTCSSAFVESMRLSAKHPGESFEILMCVGITRSANPQTFWMDGVTLTPETNK